MISVGGVVFDRSTSSDSFSVVGGRADPWDNGFGVFDMTELEWKSAFDPSADAYVTADSIKQDIQQNGFYPSVSEPMGRRIFTQVCLAIETLLTLIKRQPAYSILCHFHEIHANRILICTQDWTDSTVEKWFTKPGKSK